MPKIIPNVLLTYITPLLSNSLITSPYIKQETGQEKTQSIRHIKRSEGNWELFVDERISKGNGKTEGL